MYKEPFARSLACAIAMHLPIKQREELLERILKDSLSFPLSVEYPLPLLIAGRISACDAPVGRRDRLLMNRLKNYAGVFAEEISLDLKRRYFDALCQNRFGEPSIALASALQDLYLRLDRLAKKKKI